MPTSLVVGLIILKLVSWNNKNDKKNLEDISLLINIGWDFYEEEAYEKHLDLFEVENFEMTLAAARIIARNMKPILDSNDKLLKTIIGVLETAIKEKPKTSSSETILAIHMN